MTEMKEIKITKTQYDYIESLKYNLSKKTKYILEEVLRNSSNIDESTTFFVYKDSMYYYLVYESEISLEKNKKEKIFDVGKMIKDFEEKEDNKCQN